MPKAIRAMVAGGDVGDGHANDAGGIAIVTLFNPLIAHVGAALNA